MNIIDTNGVIIASSTAEREGSIHGGAKKIIEENLSQLIVENDLQYEGSQNGVNLPIVSQGEIVGIIGITGKVEDVFKYAQIIRPRMKYKQRSQDISEEQFRSSLVEMYFERLRVSTNSH